MGAGEKALQDFYKRNNRHPMEVPKYQRGYSWSDDQIEDFWSDLVAADKDLDSRHFFGTIYVSSSSNKSKTNYIRIVDGQQRITTAAIFLLCARDYFYSLKNEVPEATQYCDLVHEMLYETNLKTHKPDETRFILTLSRTNRDFFNDYIVPVKPVNKKLEIRNKAKNDSNVSIANAYSKFFRLIKTLEPNKPSGTKLNSLVWTLLDKFDLIQIEVPDDEHAYYMFNLINNRGTQLAESDLVKNTIFGRLDKDLANNSDLELQMDEYDRKWAEIRDNVTGQDAGHDKLDSFFQQYLIAFKQDIDSNNSKHKYTLRRKDVFSRFEKLLQSEKPTDIINDLLEWSQKFNNLRRPETEFSRYPDVVYYLNKIKAINAVNVYSVLMVGYEKYWERGSKQLFTKLTELCFKYHVRAKTLRAGVVLENYEQKLGEIAYRIITTAPNNIKEIVNEIISDDKAYPSNAKIEPQLVEFKPQNNSLAMALLEEIEKTYDSDKVSRSDVSVEHIMPRNHSQWDMDLKKHHPELKTHDDISAFHSKFFPLLGNQTLLNSPKNIQISNKPFDFKKKIYAKDSHVITNRLKSIDEWTRETIETRQLELSTKLLQILDLAKL